MTSSQTGSTAPTHTNPTTSDTNTNPMTDNTNSTKNPTTNLPVNDNSRPTTNNPIADNTNHTTGGPASHPTTDHANTTPVSDNNATTNTGADAPPPPQDEDYPEQKHAGKVGYGPNYHSGPSMGEKMAGFKEEIKGKVTRKPELVEHGKHIKTGEQKKIDEEQADKNDPFATAQEDKSTKPVPTDAHSAHAPSTGSQSQSSSQPATAANASESSATAHPAGAGHMDEDSAKVQAATVAPKGTKVADVQSQGQAVDGLRHVDARN